ncbi:MAG: hypothetical protein IKZ19_10260, partial [Clostridia bacterium]|nr:hypothetical protein [Clostridia bacterium]
FRGVDFSVLPDQVAAERSPDAKNIMVDKFGRLVKRPGFRCVGKYNGKISAIHRFEVDGSVKLIVHAGTSLWLHGASPESLYEDVGEGPSVSLVCGDRLWILTGKNYLVFDGEKVCRVSDIAYIPTVKIGCDPETGAGTIYEPVNMLSDFRRVCFVGNGESKVYLVDNSGYDCVETVKVNGQSAVFSEDMGKRTVTFTYPPPEPEVPGQDNVEIVYQKKIAGNLEMIENCRIMGLFGLGGADSDRVFFAGNPGKKNVDWHCSISDPDFDVDPTYVPDTSFAYVGADSSGILGYRRLGNCQVIIKEQSNEDAALFMRTGSVDSAGEECFALAQGASGIGCCSAATVCNLGDEPVFLSENNGICGISVNQLMGTAAVQNRSWLVDSRLTTERNLSEAAAAEWQGKYVLCINGRAYVLDSRQSKTHKEHSGSSYAYECFYWEGIPAVSLCESDGELYFGTESGELCKFNTDLGDDSAVYRDSLSEGSEREIAAFWTTARSDDGHMGKWKKTVSRQCAMLLRDTGASARVTLEMSFDGGDFETAAEFVPFGKFSFESADFSDFGFATAEMPCALGVEKKPGRYITSSMRVCNSEPGQNLLCDGITRSFYTDKKLKG